MVVASAPVSDCHSGRGKEFAAPMGEFDFQFLNLVRVSENYPPD